MAAGEPVFQQVCLCLCDDGLHSDLRGSIFEMKLPETMKQQTSKELAFAHHVGNNQAVSGDMFTLLSIIHRTRLYKN